MTLSLLVIPPGQSLSSVLERDGKEGPWGLGSNDFRQVSKAQDR